MKAHAEVHDGSSELTGSELPRLGVSLAEVETFLVVAEQRSFRKAAAQLCLSQPSVSTRIARLEDVLGVRLFDRTTRRVSLTDAGERLRQGAEVILRDLRGLLRETMQHGRHRTKSLTVACSSGVAAFIMPPLLRAFRETYPEIDVSLSDLPPSVALAAVRSGAADLGLLVVLHNAPGVMFTPLVRDHCIVVAPRGHPLLAAGTASLAETLAFPIVMSDGQTTLRRTVESMALARGLALRRAPEGRRARSIHTMFAMVEAGCGLMIQPQSLARLPSGGPLELIELNDVEMEHSFGLVTAQGADMSVEARTFETFVRATVKAHGHAWPPAG